MKYIYCYYVFFVIFLDLFHIYKFQEHYNFIHINGTYIKIKQLPLGEYLVIINNGIYKYNNDFSTKIKFYEFKGFEQLDEDNKDKITLSEYIYIDNLYSFCLIINILYLFNYNKTNITKHVLTLNPKGTYYNLIPYKHKYNKLNDSFNYIIYYIFKGNGFNYYFHIYIYEISLDCSNNNELLHLSTYFLIIPNLHLNCQIISINNKNSLICFFLSDNSQRIIVEGYDIEDNNIKINMNYSNKYPKEELDTKKM